MRLISQWKITATMQLLTGTRIGGGNDILSIGGAENSCIKHPTTFEPYIPGSSLKGKLRSELEMQLGKVQQGGKPCDCCLKTCLICRVFGPHMKLGHELGPVRIVVRDAHLLEGGNLEVKESTSINRETNTAQNGSLRSEERVAAGSTFHFEIMFKVLDEDKDCVYDDSEGKEGKGADAFFNFIEHGCSLLEQSGIGAGVSRGNGQVKFYYFAKHEIKRVRLGAE